MTPKQILLVDSSGGGSAFTRLSLGPHYAITTCRGFTAAHEFLDQGQFDVIMIALNHYETDTVELFFKSLQDKTHNAALIMINHQIDRAAAAQYMQAGADNVILHRHITENPEDLVEAIEFALARRDHQAHQLRAALLKFEREHFDDLEAQELGAAERLQHAYTADARTLKQEQTGAATTLKEALDTAALLLKREQGERAAELKDINLLHITELNLVEEDKQKYVNNYLQMFHWMHGGYMMMSPAPDAYTDAGRDNPSQADTRTHAQQQAADRLGEQQHAATQRDDASSKQAEHKRLTEESAATAASATHQREAHTQATESQKYGVLRNQKPRDN